jgi:hypothetical protein
MQSWIDHVAALPSGVESSAANFPACSTVSSKVTICPSSLTVMQRPLFGRVSDGRGDKLLYSSSAKRKPKTKHQMTTRVTKARQKKETPQNERHSSPH